MAFKQKHCLYFGIALCLIAGIFILILAITRENNPLIITLSMMLMAVGAIFPINILYPHSLNVVEGTKSRASAMIMFLRLITVSAALSVISYFYDHTFLVIGLGVSFFMLLSVFFLYKLLARKWILLDN